MEHNDNVGQQSISTSHKVNDTTHHKTSSKDGMASTSGTQSVGGGSTNVTATAPLATSTQQGSDARSTTDTLPTYITTSGQPQTATTSTTAATTTVPTANMTTTSSEQQPPTVTTATTAAAAAAAADESALQNQKLVEEFQYLLEKSQSLFSGLRDLPPTGSHRQWRPYFEKTFEVYTKLWKFQQTHRPVLEDKNNYGLKRWEVGEIASKIGQLYYHYYLRTSDTSYLQEAFVFYDAIHERQYFKDILEVKNPALMIKKMRYYARFVVVSLLLNKDSNIRLLISELESLVDEYTKSFKPPDAKEWQIVLDEINTFMEAEKKLAPVSADRTPVTVEHRLSWTSGPARDTTATHTKLKLQEAILVGNCQKQIKFSELTLDMYRILQSLEMQPPGSATVVHPPLSAPIGSNKAGAITTDQGSGQGDGKDPVMSKEKSSTTTRSVNTTGGGNESTTTGNNNSNTTTNTTSSASFPDSQQPQPSSQDSTSPSQEQTSSQQQSQQQQQQQQQQQNNPTTTVTTATNTATATTTGGAAGIDKGVIARRINPHKYLLYRPSLTQLFVYISTAFKDTADNGVMLLYLSADGCEYPDARDPGYKSGVATNSRKAQQQQQQQSISTASGIASTERSDSTPASGAGTGGNTSSATGSGSGSGGSGGGSGGTGPTTGGGGSTSTSTNPISSSNNTTSGGSPSTTHTTVPPIVPSVHCLHPADLIPFTRKPLFLIVDSSSSGAFNAIPNIFDQPVMSLMSPVEYPSSVQDRSEIGSLFTLFLHTPLLGFCSVSDIGNLDQSIWDECVALISSMEQKIGETLLSHPDVDGHVKRFMSDEFLWTFIVRFTLCCIILRCHSSFKDEKTFPSCYPPLPGTVYSSPDIIAMLCTLTDKAEVATYFSLPFVNEEPIE